MQQAISSNARRVAAFVLAFVLAASLLPVPSLAFAAEPLQDGEGGVAPLSDEAIDDSPNPLAESGLQTAAFSADTAQAPIRADRITSSEGRVYKDVTAIRLYTLVDDAVEEVHAAPAGDLGDYIAYVAMANAPAFYADVTGASEGELVIAGPEGDSITVPFPLAAANGGSSPFMESLKGESGYEASRAVAYANAVKASPFASADEVIRTGNRLSDTLASQPMRSIIAFDADGAVVPCKDVEAVGAKVVFDDLTVLDGSISDGVLTVAGQDLPYEFCGYAMGPDNAAVAKLQAHIESNDYMDYLGRLLGSQTDNRVQRDYWDDVVQPRAALAARDVLANSGTLAATAPDNPVYGALLEQALGTEGDAATLEMLPLLYAYNYIQRWYDFDIEGLRVADLLLYAGDFYGRNCTLDNFAASFAASTPAQRLGENNQIGYAQLIYPCLGQNAAIANVKLFVENLVDVFTDFECADDWFMDAYNETGVVVEMEPWEEGYSWRAWQNLSKNGTGPHVQNGTKRILPFLTLPDHSYYAFSMPGVFSYGSSAMYYDDPSQNQEALRQRILKNKDRYLNYLQTLLGFTGRKAEFNAMLVLDQDKQCVSPQSRWHSWLGEDGTTDANASQDSMVKGFYEVLKLPSPAAGTAASAGDETVRWRSSGKLDDFSAWSHQMGHCLEQPILLGGGSAKGAEGDCTAGRLDQGMAGEYFGMNLAYEAGYEEACAFNSDCKRIDSPQKAQSFWKGLFEAIDLLDYLELKAFLRLSAEEQQAVASQLWYGGSAESREGGDTGYKSFTLYDPASIARFADEDGFYVSAEVKKAGEGGNLAAGPLDSIEDVLDHRVVLHPGVTAADHPEFSSQSRGRDSVLSRWWYTPHYDYGGTEGAARESLCLRMFGEDGYQGYQRMASGIPSDTAALTASTGKSSFKQYKLDTYNGIEQKISRLTCLDAEVLEDECLSALQAAAAAGDRSLSAANDLRMRCLSLMKSATGDFEESIYGAEAASAEAVAGDSATRDGAVPVASVEDFLAMARNPEGSYRLAADIDFSGLDTSQMGGALVSGDFTGELDGAGFTLSGLEGAALFSRFCGTAKDMRIHRFTNEQPSADGVAAFSKRLADARIENIEFCDIDLAGLHRMGALTGWDEGSSVLSRISVVNSTAVAGDGGCYNSLLIGRKSGGSLTDASVQGRLVCQGSENGGICGSAKGTAFTRVLSDADIVRLPSDREQRNRNAGFLGNFDGNGGCSLDACLFTGTVTGDAFAFTGAADSRKGSFADCYELQSSGGIPSADGAHIVAYRKEQASAPEFWEGLGFALGSWSYDCLADGRVALVYGGRPWDIEAVIDYGAESLTFQGADAQGLVVEGFGAAGSDGLVVSLTAALDTPGWDHRITVTKADDGTHGGGYKRTLEIPERPDAPAFAVAPPADGDPKTRGTIVFPAGGAYQMRTLNSGNAWATVSEAWLGSPLPVRPGIMEVRSPAVAGRAFVSKVALADLRYSGEDTSGTYKLALDARGGRLAAIPTEYVAGSPVTLPLPLRTGYTFAGWYDNDRFEGDPVVRVDANATGDKAFYARWLSLDTSVDFIALRGVPAMGGDDGVFSIALPAGSELPQAWSEFAVTAAAGTSVSGATDDGGATWAMTVRAQDGRTEGAYRVHVTAGEADRSGWDIWPAFDFQNETLVITGADAAGITVEGVSEDAVTTAADGQGVIVALGERLDDRSWDHALHLLKADEGGGRRSGCDRWIEVPRRPTAPDPQTSPAGFRSGLGSISLSGEPWEYRRGAGDWQRADSEVSVGPGDYEVRISATPNSFPSHRVGLMIAEAPDAAEAIDQVAAESEAALLSEQWIVPASAASSSAALDGLIDNRLARAVAQAVAGSELHPGELTCTYRIRNYQAPVDGGEDEPSGTDGGFDLDVTFTGAVDTGRQGFTLLGLLQPRTDTCIVSREVSIPVSIAASAFAGNGAARAADGSDSPGGSTDIGRGLAVEPDPASAPEPEAGTAVVSLMPCGAFSEAGAAMRVQLAGPETAMGESQSALGWGRPAIAARQAAGDIGAAASYGGLPWFALPALMLGALALMGCVGGGAFLLHRHGGFGGLLRWVAGFGPKIRDAFGK